jgi:hypothetical protein
MVRRLLLAMVAALTAAALAVGFAAAPVAAAPPTGPAAASPARQDAEIQVRRGLFPNLSACAVAGGVGVFLKHWDRWLCAPQIVGWRLYTNR